MFKKIVKHKIGAHLSSKGTPLNIFTEAKNLEIKVAACFTSPRLQYGIERNVSHETSEKFKEICRKENFETFSHGCYVINIADSQKETNYKNSLAAVVQELKRCESLGMIGAVIHPGSNPNKKLGLETVANSIEEIFFNFYPKKTSLLIETSAGQGNTMPVSMEDATFIRKKLSKATRKKCKIVLDTCHLHSAGYNLSKYKDVVNFLDLVSTEIGFENIALIHLNDSKYPCGSKKDRHANIGNGTISLEGIAAFLNDEKIKRIPKILETPVSHYLEWKKDFAVLEKILE